MKINFDTAVADFNKKQEEEINELGGQLFAAINDLIENGVPGRKLAHSEQVMFLTNMTAFTNDARCGTSNGALPTFNVPAAAPATPAAVALPAGGANSSHDASESASTKKDLDSAMELISALVDGDDNVIYDPSTDKVNIEQTLANVRDARTAQAKELNDLRQKLREAEVAKEEAFRDKTTAETAKASAERELAEAKSADTATKVLPANMVDKAEVAKIGKELASNMRSAKLGTDKVVITRDDVAKWAAKTDELIGGEVLQKLVGAPTVPSPAIHSHS
ncbi:hypothetical protein KI440_03460 [Candidatus Saccharibacteria bacterium TM7i]|nr:hypothetical protein KI440_03460 [Candidatus Saccharibacteria bacterium TM7i]